MEHVPSAAWNPLEFNRTVNRTHRRLVVPMSFVFPGVPAIEEDFPASEVPSEINMDVRRFWFLSIREFVRNWDSIVDVVHLGIGWIRELLPP